MTQHAAASVHCVAVLLCLLSLSLLSTSSPFASLFVSGDCGADICRDGRALVLSKGYPFEDHYVMTPDCYTLRMFRIPAGRRNQVPPMPRAPDDPTTQPKSNSESQSSSSSSTVSGSGAQQAANIISQLKSSQVPMPFTNGPGKPVVMLQHGVLDSADSFIINSAEQSLGFLLADAGFDVWLGNTRGNKYSRNSTCYNPDSWIDHRFWDWSFDEMAQFDLPSQVKYALAVSGQKQLTLIAHSQGSTQTLVNFMSSQTVAPLINAFIALAPVFYMRHTKSILLKGMATMHLDTAISLMRVHELLPDNKLWRLVTPRACKHASWMCSFGIFLMCGYDVTDIDVNRLPIYMAHFPAGVSMRELIHYAQMIRSNTVKAFDFGYRKNKEAYGAHNAPTYNISNAKAPPTYIFYGEQDELANSIDVQRLIREFPPESLAGVYYHSSYGHVDFVS